jgi:hypothetical protein
LNLIGSDESGERGKCDQEKKKRAAKWNTMEQNGTLLGIRGFVPFGLSRFILSDCGGICHGARHSVLLRNVSGLALWGGV